MKTIQIVLLLVLAQVVFAEPPVIEWIKEYPHEGYLQVGGGILLNNGNFVLSGERNEGRNHIIFLLCTNSKGKELWFKEYPYPWLSWTLERKFFVDSSNNIIMAGQSNDERFHENSSRWFFQMKINQHGDTIETNRWLDSLDRHIGYFILTDSGAVNFIVQDHDRYPTIDKNGQSIYKWYIREGESGFTQLANGGWLTVRDTKIHQPFQDKNQTWSDAAYTVIQTYKYNSRGLLVNEGYFRCRDDCNLYSKLFVLPDSSIFRSGCISRRLDGWHTRYTRYFVHLNSNLDTICAREYTSNFGQGLEFLITVPFVRPNGSFIEFFTSFTNPNDGSKRFYLAEYDSLGNPLWENLYGDSTIDVRPIGETPDGGLLFAGEKHSDIHNSNPCLVKLRYEK